MADALARAVEDDALFLGEGFDGRVLGQVGIADVLDPVVQGVDRLLRITHSGRSQSLEFRQHRRGVVMGHDVVGADGDVIAGVNLTACGPVHGVGLGDLLDDCLSHDSVSSQALG